MKSRFPRRSARALAAALLALACRPTPDAPRAADPVPLDESPPVVASLPEPLLVDRAADLGLDFVHENGRTGRFRYCEMMGAGAALFDADRDGDLDVYLVQGGPLEGEDGPRPTDRLFRNQLRETGTLAFVDVTDTSGLAEDGYGMGVLAADLDGDGWTDLYVTNLGQDRLWRNRGDGTFEDATAAAGLDGSGWSVSAAVLDLELDGDLDLFVGRYLEYSVAGDKECTDELGARNYCGPLSFPPLPDRLWRNRGDGTFEDVSDVSGITGAFGGALGVLADDVDGDDLPDLYVANDGMANQLWMNRGDGTFEDRALLAGCAVNGEGRAEAGMGVTGADVDGDGDEDLVVGHLDGETNTFYLNDGHGIFTDRSAESGLGAPSFDRTTFGVGWIDAENDGDLDLVAVNGAVKILKELALAGDPWPLHQPDQLFLAGEDGRWEHTSGSGLDAGSEVSRGAAFGDVDEDGDVDVLVTHNGGPARLYLSEAADHGTWISVQLVDAADRPVIGATARLLDPDGGPPGRIARVRLGDSYGSTSDPRLHFGLGADERSRTVRARWPNGVEEDFGPVATGEATVLRPGTGRPAEEAE